MCFPARHTSVTSAQYSAECGTTSRPAPGTAHGIRGSRAGSGIWPPGRNQAGGHSARVKAAHASHLDPQDQPRPPTLPIELSVTATPSRRQTQPGMRWTSRKPRAAAPGKLDFMGAILPFADAAENLCAQLLHSDLPKSGQASNRRPDGRFHISFQAARRGRTGWDWEGKTRARRYFKGKILHL
jgi:hypothetical protein